MLGSAQAKDRSLTPASPGFCFTGGRSCIRRVMAWAPGSVVLSWLARIDWVMSLGLAGWAACTMVSPIL